MFLKKNVNYLESNMNNFIDYNGILYPNYFITSYVDDNIF